MKSQRAADCQRVLPARRVLTRFITFLVAFFVHFLVSPKKKENEPKEKRALVQIRTVFRTNAVQITTGGVFTNFVSAKFVNRRLCYPQPLNYGRGGAAGDGEGGYGLPAVPYD